MVDVQSMAVLLAALTKVLSCAASLPARTCTSKMRPLLLPSAVATRLRLASMERIPQQLQHQELLVVHQATMVLLRLLLGPDHMRL